MRGVDPRKTGWPCLRCGRCTATLRPGGVLTCESCGWTRPLLKSHDRAVGAEEEA